MNSPIAGARALQIHYQPEPEDDIVPFGESPFDHFIIEKWDASAVLSRDEQHRALISQWLSIGRYGRAVYYKRMVYSPPLTPLDIPAHIPQDLHTQEQRTLSYNTSGNALWIRTWYGTESETSNLAADDSSSDAAQVSRAEADCAYIRLWTKTFATESLGNHLIFDTPSVLCDDLPTTIEHPVPNAHDPPPPYVISAFMRFPDLMEGIRDEDWHNDTCEEIIQAEEELDGHDYEQLLVMVADREACEEGWVLLMGLNHRGRVLSMRMRTKASRVNMYATGGDHLYHMEQNEDDGEDLDVVYDDWNTSGDGWEDN